MRALLVILLVGSAHADPPPTLRISTDDWATRIERVTLAVHGAPETTWLTIALAGRPDRFISLKLDVPAGTRVFGLGVAEEGGGVWGRPMLVGDAQIRHRSADVSALLAWSDDDHYRVSVETPSTIEIALHLPPLEQLAIEANAAITRVEVDGKKRFVAKQSRRRELVDLANVAGTTDECPDCASEAVSLVAAKARVVDFFEPLRSTPRFVHRDIDKAIIRRYIKRHKPQLRHCFMKVAQWNPSMKGGATLAFMINSEGTIDWATTTESDLPSAITDCLVENVLRWEFPAADGHVQVNYPIEFRLAE